MKPNRIILQVIVHVAVWLCFFMLPFAFIPHPKDGPFIPDQYISFFFILSSLIYIAFYYLNYYILIPKLLEKRKVMAFLCVTVVLMLFFGVYPRLYRYLSDDLHRLPPIPWASTRNRNLSPPFLSGYNLAISLLVFVVSTGIKIVSSWFEYERKNREIQNDKLNTELSFLKSQINPHFLFNTLNNIYALAEARSEKTAEAVLKLSSTMRYVLTEAKNESVPLEKEIQFTTNYIELQKMRLTGKSIVSFTISGDPVGKQISPLLFLPFVENAFKYGVSTRESSPIGIKLDIHESRIDFNVVNKKYTHSLLKPADTTGIGISNIKRRLELLYRNRYKLNLDDENATYTVNLNIQL